VHDAASRTVCATRSQAPPASQRAGVAASVVLAVATGAISSAARPLGGWPFPKHVLGARAHYNHKHNQQNEASMPACSLRTPPVSCSSPLQVPCHARPARTSALARGHHPARTLGCCPRSAAFGAQPASSKCQGAAIHALSPLPHRRRPPPLCRSPPTHKLGEEHCAGCERSHSLAFGIWGVILRKFWFVARTQMIITRRTLHGRVSVALSDFGSNGSLLSSQALKAVDNAHDAHKSSAHAPVFVFFLARTRCRRERLSA